MPPFQRVIAAFSSLGIPDYALLTQNEVYAAFDALSQRNAPHLGSFQPEVANELWQ